jgi:hypothetical protein
MPGLSYRRAWLIAARASKGADRREALRNVLRVHPPTTWSTGVRLIGEDA